jgi:hypothetical protein
MIKFIFSSTFFYTVIFCWLILWEIPRHKFIQKLKLEHYQLWEQLGSPHGLLSGIIFTNRHDFEYFLLMKQYKDVLLEDLSLQKEAEKLRIVLITCIMFLILFFVLLMFDLMF